MYFEWKEQYSVNIPEIDRQHKRLLEIGQRVYDLLAAKDDFDHYDEIMTILDELREYTIYHFTYEEKLLEKHQYAQLDDHKLEHKFAVRKLQRVGNKDVDRQQKEALVDLITFISDWIAGHILKVDMKYKELLQGTKNT